MARITPAVAVFVIMGAWLGAADAAPLTADKVSAAVAERYNVTVLRATPTTIGDRPAYALAVMNPGGDDNGAFKVTTLIVDAETGALVSQFIHLPAGYDLPAPSDRSPRDDGNGPLIRSWTEREYRQR